MHHNHKRNLNVLTLNLKSHKNCKIIPYVLSFYLSVHSYSDTRFYLNIYSLFLKINIEISSLFYTLTLYTIISYYFPWSNSHFQCAFVKTMYQMLNYYLTYVSFSSIIIYIFHIPFGVLFNLKLASITFIIIFTI